jgi:hypothetical protein
MLRITVLQIRRKMWSVRHIDQIYAGIQGSEAKHGVRY